MLTPQQIREAESEENAHHQRIDETFLHREDSEAAWERWRLACADWHASRRSTDFLWEDSTRERLRAGDPATVEDAIVFLETDPWFFRSGYLKERVIGALKRAPFSSGQRERLRHTIVGVCRGRNRREFRDYCGLAVAVWTREFEETIRAEASAHDLESRGKFSYLLKYLDEKSASRGFGGGTLKREL
jgi:hypothetical protein